MALSTCMYHNIILNEVQEQVLNLVGHSNFTGIQVLPVQQQSNGSDCGVFAAAFATCLAYGIHSETVQFDVPKMSFDNDEDDDETFIQVSTCTSTK